MIDKRIISEKSKSAKTFLMLKKIFNIIITIIFIPILIISVLMLVQSVINKENIPNIGGYKFFVITSGSMEPTIHVSDFIVVKESKVTDLSNNDIISFKQDNYAITVKKL